MKKLFIVACLLTTGLLQAQNKKGNLLIGTYFGSSGIGFGNSTSQDLANSVVFKSKNNSFNIGVGPSIGKYVSNNLILGAYLGISYSSGKNDRSNNTNSATSISKNNSVYFSAGPFLRYYMKAKNDGKGSGNTFIHFNPGVSFYPSDNGSYTPSSGTSYEYKTQNYISWYTNLNVGYEHYLNDVLGIYYQIGYSYSHYSYKYFYDYSSGTDYTTKYKGTSNGINFGAGLNIHLKCSKKKK